ncbi:MAG: GNAT family N-acetyltransferase [Marmoricola sp.]
MPPTLEFLADPAEFLHVASAFLAARPVQGTIPASTTARIITADADGVPRGGGYDYWWMVVRDDAGAVVGAAMRTAPFAPYPPYLLAMPEQAAVDLARALVDRGEEVGGLNGALPAATVCAEEIARLRRQRVTVAEHLRLFELRALTEPAHAPAGRLRQAREEETEQMLGWYEAFDAAAAEQAGRDPPHPGPQADEASMLRRIRSGGVWVWVDETDRPVSVVGVRPPAYGVSCIAPVYTPASLRGRGYAGAAVAELSRRMLADGVRPCLFTDQANPTSNALYQRLGFRPVEDQVNQLLLARP